MMTAQDILQLLRARPFVPFRLYASDGRAYEVRQPDQALVLMTRVILPLSAGNGVPEQSEHLALSHVIRAEELSTESAKSDS